MNRIAISLSLISAVTIAGFIKAEPQEEPAGKQITVRVLVLYFDPMVAEQNKRLHQVCGWADPRRLANGYLPT